MLIRFEDHAEGTELVLTQTNFIDEGARDGHGKGWISTFNSLATYLG